MNPTTTTGNAFDTLLREHNKGRTLADLNEAFPELVRQVRQHGKAGVLTFSIKVAPASGGDAHQVSVTGSVSVKAPTAMPRAQIYYTTEEGGVQKNDPNQAEMKFTSLPAPADAPAPQPAVTTATA